MVVLRCVGKNEEAASVGLGLVVKRRALLVADIVDDLCSC